MRNRRTGTETEKNVAEKELAGGVEEEKIEETGDG